jgi:hypothetical protein
MPRALLLSVIALLLGPSLLVAGDDFAGKWVKSDDKPGSVTRLEISKKDKAWTIQAWGSSGGRGDIDQGSVTLHLLGDTVGDTEMKYGIAFWDHKFKDSHVTLRLEKDELIVEDFNVFKDDSGRSNYRTAYKFKRAK